LVAVAGEVGFELAGGFARGLHDWGIVSRRARPLQPLREERPVASRVGFVVEDGRIYATIQPYRIEDERIPLERLEALDAYSQLVNALVETGPLPARRDVDA
jgi:hypothetical protein